MTQVPSPAPYEVDMVVHSCNTSTWGIRSLRSFSTNNFEVSLGYMRSCLEKQNEPSGRTCVNSSVRVKLCFVNNLVEVKLLFNCNYWLWSLHTCMGLLLSYMAIFRIIPLFLSFILFICELPQVLLLCPHQLQTLSLIHCFTLSMQTHYLRFITCVKIILNLPTYI